MPKHHLRPILSDSLEEETQRLACFKFTYDSNVHPGWERMV